MDPIALGVVLSILLLVILAGGLWIALALAVVGGVAMTLFTSAPVGKVMATTIWGQSTEWSLTALPLFVWMGEILYRTRLTDDMFSGLSPWLTRLPGRLLHVNVLACGIFAAVSGSSTATTATIGRITIPELTKRGYDEGMVLGSLAGSGTLGILIPPSIIMIVYGVAADVSINRLFIAGFLPGLMLMALFSSYIALYALWRPREIPRSDIQMTFVERVYQSRRLIPVIFLVFAVIGAIYGGIATATEAAAIGVLGSLVLALFTGTLTWSNFRESVMSGTRTSCMIAFILAGSAFLTVAMGFTGIPRALAEMAGAYGLSQAGLLAILTVLFIILGCFLDGISIVVLTTSVLMPLVTAAKIDTLWFGIYMVFVVEMGLVTPPVGFNLFVIQGLTNRNLVFIGRVAFPFFICMVIGVVLIAVFPQIVTFLPAQMTTG